VYQFAVREVREWESAAGIVYLFCGNEYWKLFRYFGICS